MPLINCEINLILTRSENCESTRKSTRDAYPDAYPALAAIDNPTNAIFNRHKIVCSTCYFIN